MIKLRDITKSYGDIKVLRNINLEISRGEIVSIVGPSGAGKSTLLQIMGSLDRPDSGVVKYEDTDIFALRNKELAHWRNGNIGFVFQFHQLLPEFSMLENVAMPALIAGASRKEAFNRASDIIDMLGLQDRANHRPAQLSGGECQRAAVARALINNPQVILADEPTGSLDSHNRDQLQQLFLNLREQLGQTFVIVTHDEALSSGADRVIHMKDGSIVS